MKKFLNPPVGFLAGILLCNLAAIPAWADEPAPKALVGGGGGGLQPLMPAQGPGQFVFRTVPADDYRADSKEVPWLGVGVAESTEPLSAQLGLKPGEGLVVNYVATNSPAGEAGLQRNDVLVELDGQMLVDPIQLRKLVQMHADGDSVKIEFYRAGKKQSATAKLNLRPFNQASIDGDSLPYDIRKNQFLAPNPHAFAPRTKAAPTLDKEQFNIQVQQARDQAKRAMEQAQRTVEDAMRQTQNDTEDVNRKLWTIQKKLGALADGGMKVGNDATVVVNNEGESVRTIVKKDDSGTYIIVADPAKHLTAHDPNGKLLFDGLIESTEQQRKVPKEVWKKVQPMLDQLDQPADDKRLPHDNPEEE